MNTSSHDDVREPDGQVNMVLLSDFGQDTSLLSTSALSSSASHEHKCFVKAPSDEFELFQLFGFPEIRSKVSSNGLSFSYSIRATAAVGSPFRRIITISNIPSLEVACKIFNKYLDYTFDKRARFEFTAEQEDKYMRYLDVADPAYSLYVSNMLLDASHAHAQYQEWSIGELHKLNVAASISQTTKLSSSRATTQITPTNQAISDDACSSIS